MLLRAARQRRVYLVHQLSPGLPPIASAELLVQQIFLNLAFNAIEQMAAAGMVQGELRVSTAHVQQSPQPMRVTFSDCGPGIHAAHYEQIFELGFTTRAGGTGQGLYISRNAAEALGGELQLIESFMGWGSAFELRRQYGPRSRRMTNTDNHTKQLLIVDDDIEAAQALGEALSEWFECTISYADSGPLPRSSSPRTRSASMSR